MKYYLFFFCFFLIFNAQAQYTGNTTLNYSELIDTYEKLAEEHEEIELYAMGPSDYGLPIYLCVINGAEDSIATFQKAQSSTTLLINNAIHPGEPDGVNACLIWINDWISSGKKMSNLPVIGIIPAYNVGGMMNRSGTSRANQDGPEEYGFRGNAQNLDLNRDFIKMDALNSFTFASIFHALDPDVFIDTHVSNGADYQYTMTYIASVRERMAPELGMLMHEKMIPALKSESSRKGFDLIPYVHTHDEVPDNGIEVFNDLPRYAMGYASLMNAISFTTETHMLKPFPQRVQATLSFLEASINWMGEQSEEIEQARSAARAWELDMEYYKYNYRITEDTSSIAFKGYSHSRSTSELTDLPRLKYHRDQPYEKNVAYYHTYAPVDSLFIPDFYVVEGQCRDVINRLKANKVSMSRVTEDTSIQGGAYRIKHFESPKRPYEGHYLHTDVEAELSLWLYQVKPGDYIIPTEQKNARFIISVLDPETPDSYFAWNFFDSYLQQKEYFSPYVFEDKAIEILENDPGLKERFEKKKMEDEEFRKSSWSQLYFIYTNSPYYEEDTHNVLPVHSGMNTGAERN